MKRKDLEYALKECFWSFLRHGGNHDVWTNGTLTQPVPRHNEVNERLAKHILKIAQNNPGEKETRS
jgi:mRNA interferase HicA